MKKRKIIEIYATENKEETTSFDFKRVEDSETANYMMKLITNIFVTMYVEKE